MANDFSPRADTRIDTQRVSCSTDCSIGRVADLTGQGMRLIVQNSPLPAVGDIKEYTFTDQDSGHQLTIQGTTRWIRKGSPLNRRCQIGIEFVNLPPSHRDALLHLAVLGQLVISNDPSTPQTTAEEHSKAFELNLYEIFSISPYASESQIKAAFHKLAKKWHPDHNDSPQAPARIEELHKAYSILKDPTLRARYDSSRNPGQDAA